MSKTLEETQKTTQEVKIKIVHSLSQCMTYSMHAIWYTINLFFLISKSKNTNFLCVTNAINYYNGH